MENNNNNNNNNNNRWTVDVSCDWIPVESMLEVRLEEPENDFPKIIETLTRIGIESRDKSSLTQSCHILQKKGKYYIVHFKELFLLDGKTANFTYADLCRRNTIALLLEEWNMLTIIEKDSKIGEDRLPSLRQIKIVSYKDKGQYELRSKYQIGIERRFDETSLGLPQAVQ